MTSADSLPEPPPMEPRFFQLADALRPHAFRVEMVSPGIDPWMLLRGGVAAERVAFQQMMGSRPYDLIGCGDGFSLLLSRRLLDALRAAGLSGWDTYRVRVVAWGGSHLEGYGGFCVTGRCGPTDIARSRPTVRNGMAVRLGLLFDPTTWDGSDVFSPEGTGLIFVTERAADLLRRLEPTNLELQDTREVENWRIE